MAKFSDERVRAIIAGPRAFRTYLFPGSDDLRIAMRVLTEAELDECRLAAQTELRDRAKSRGWDSSGVVDVDPELLSRMIERHIVFRATYDPDTIDGDDPVRFFSVPKDVTQLDSVTATKLSELYLEHQEWCSPLRQMSAEDVDALVDALGKAQMPEVFLGAFAPSMLRRFAISLASRLRAT